MLDASKFVNEAEKEIVSKLSGKGILACSGGQDSTLLAVLANKAAGDRILTVFVDTGFLRNGEKERVRAIFEKFGLNYLILDETERFVSRMKGVTEPVTKAHLFCRTITNLGRSWTDP